MLMLTPLQARGLAKLAGEGAEGLLNDAEAARAYVGNKRAQDAAREALSLLNAALFSSDRSE